MLKKIGAIMLAGVVGLGGLEIGARLSGPGATGFVAPAKAEVGRPLTPVSVAGVARRTARRHSD